MSKNYLFLAMSAALLAACSNDVDLGASTQRAETVDNAIAFQMINRNSITSRTDGYTALNGAGHYNFGVFAYKSTPTSTFSLTGATEIMHDYLVGYGPDSNGPGYKMATTSQSTYGDGKADGNSPWAYEKLGNADYTYSGSDSYYKGSGSDINTFYLSNKKNQFLKYWDKSTAQTDFFAYAPYLRGTQTTGSDGDITSLASVQASGANTTITFPMVEGYDDASMYDYIAAHKTVAQTNYGNKVQIQFQRLSAKIKIGFYENIDGYKVKILKLSPNDESSTAGVSAAPAKLEGTTYKYGTLYSAGTGTGTYTPASGSDGTFTVSVAGTTAYTATVLGQTKTIGDYINFEVPACCKNGYISDQKSSPSESDTQYFLIPVDNSTDKTGLTFHVTYQLKAEDSDETITVYNATVHVPYDNGKTDNDFKEYCNWQSNTVYTYIFRITKNSSGSTDDPGKDNIDPASPDASDKEALSPIIFDNCEVQDWTTAEKQEFDINKEKKD